MRKFLLIAGALMLLLSAHAQPAKPQWVYQVD
jgi:hypothetical protein